LSRRLNYQSYSYRSNLLSQSVRDGSLIAVLGLAVYFAQTALQHAQQVSAINQELANEISDQADGGGITAPESAIATICGSDAQDPPILQIEEILQTAVTEVQRILPDRVLIFQLGSDGSGKVVQRWFRGRFLGRPLILAFNKGMWSGIARDGLVLLPTWRRLTSTLPCGISTAFCSEGQPCPDSLREELWGLLIAHQCATAAVD